MNMDYINDLEQLCESIGEALREANDKIKKAGGKLTAGDVAYIDQITHAMKSIKTTLAMLEGGYSGDYSRNGSYGRVYQGNSYEEPGRGSYRGGGSYDDGRSMDGNGSYARGRSMDGNSNRGSMGRYSQHNDRAHGAEEMAQAIREMMPNIPEHLHSEAQHFVQKLEDQM
jgi:hypothetical protein